jgi:signal transduction histidine kinase
MNPKDTADPDGLGLAADALLVVTEAGLVAVANEEAERLFGAEATGLAGRPLSALLTAGVPVERLPQVPGALAPLGDVKHGDAVFALRAKRLRPPLAFSLSLRDVTAERRAEARRLQVYSVVAHDLRSPLGAVMLRTALIRRGKYGTVPQGLLTDVEKIEGTLHGLVELVNDFIEFARLQSPELVLERAPVDLLPLVEAAVRERARADGARPPEISGPAAPVVVSGDAVRLAQALGHVVGRAVACTPASSAVVVRVVDGPEEIEIAVEDDGPALAPEQLALLFEDVVRAEPKAAGSGIGLLNARQILEAHGGRARAAPSGRPTGSVLSLFLPKRAP